MDFSRIVHEKHFLQLDKSFRRSNKMLAGTAQPRAWTHKKVHQSLNAIAFLIFYWLYYFCSMNGTWQLYWFIFERLNLKI